ncbi:MAG: glycoside hydrolase family 127 protein [Bacteroidales bacterium]
MKTGFNLLTLAIILIIFGCSEKSENRFYRNNPEPLKRNAYIKLPLGSVKPAGWLKDQLNAQARGLTGNLDDFWPDLVNSSWRGKDGEAWERGPYYLDGLIPLAYLLDDSALIKKSSQWIENILASSTDSGWYGPSKNKDRWPLAVANKVLMQYYEATSDKRALDVLIKYFKYIKSTPPDWPDKEWRGVRAMENAVTGYWLLRQTGEEWITEAIESIQKNSPDWTTYYEKFPWDSAAWSDKKIPLNWNADGLTAHVVNNAMAIKYPGLWYQQSGDQRFRNAVFEGIRKYDLHHGQVGGRFSGDEHLSGNTPDRGTELCSIVEYMFSLENLYEIFGDNTLADRLELLTYNALPGTTTADMWAHQYDQQSNQVLVTVDKRNWSTNRDQSNIYGFRPNFGCCLANMHQGWPKFVEHMWMATNDNGVVAVAYGPSVVKAKVGKGNEVTITEETEYPFRGSIVMSVSLQKTTTFPIHLRVPSWGPARITTPDGVTEGKPGGTVILKRKWHDGDKITIDLPNDIKYEKRYNGSVTIKRGPLYFAERIGKEYKKAKLDYDNYSYMGSADWEIRPTSNWNYGIILDIRKPASGFVAVENPVSKYPFADVGDMIWNADSSDFTAWDQPAPVVLKARGFSIPGWGMKDNSADLPPVSPVKPTGAPEEIILVPYGSAKLRITEFPLMDVIFMETIEMN